MAVESLHIWPNIHGLSAGRLWPSAPKVKVKKRVEPVTVGLLACTLTSALSTVVDIVLSSYIRSVATSPTSGQQCSLCTVHM